MLMLVHYGEIALKGKNRNLFEKQLIENIKDLSGGSVKRLYGRLVVKGADVESLRNVFGITWIAPVFKAPSDKEAIGNLILKRVKDRLTNNPTFGIFVNRADKKFPSTSIELAKDLGFLVQKTYHLKVDLNSPQLPIYVEITPDETYLYFERVSGFGGLPVGVSGKVLSLLSGGIDSAVASFLMMKRGCRVDFLHFHVFPENELVLRTKLNRLLPVINRYQPKSRLFLSPYHLFQLSVGDMQPGYELVLFRRFMIKIAETIAYREGYQAVVTGDSLGQVASQTLNNLQVVEEASSLPIYRPLITFDKQEIVDLAKRISSFEISIEPYKDCCSIIIRRPKINTKLDMIKKIERKLDMKKLLSENINLIEDYPIIKGVINESIE